MKIDFEYVWETPTYTDKPKLIRIVAVTEHSRIKLQVAPSDFSVTAVGELDFDNCPSDINDLIEILTTLRGEYYRITQLNATSPCPQ